MLLAKRERTSFLFSWQLRGALILSTGFYLAQFWTKPRARWSRKRGNRASRQRMGSRSSCRCAELNRAKRMSMLNECWPRIESVSAGAAEAGSVLTHLTRAAEGAGGGGGVCVLRIASFFKEVPIQNVHPS